MERDPKKCSEALEAFWGNDGPRLWDERAADWQAHVAACEDCASVVRGQERLSEVWERIRGRRAPTEVRDRLLTTIAMERARRAGEVRVSPRRRPQARRYRWWMAGALAVGGVGAVLISGGTRGIDPFVEDQLRREVALESIESDDPTEVANFVVRELGVSMDPSSLAALELVRAEICLLEGKRAAMVTYRSESGTLSHYLRPREAGPLRRDLLQPRPGSTSNPSVVRWVAGDLEHALVGRMNEAWIVSLAEGMTARLGEAE